ncbi:hypothetical protein BJ085DRAFT_29705 [Dimargaris cristalligena]|uniref:Uncharacterized protein n=1 Tax=Dimargaris cristalligena TaxID=215637 RepID=A0A4Q0A226_9FUNG|nr:hypothetical protein BJ085DRAFT_29705 [Dimargaris cristalligena]|eukprot:RKP39541.1 hypothetical protein BJ085DRAFT_29705 [Dimargaris cristalligena]
MSIAQWSNPLCDFLDRLGLHQTTDTLRFELLNFSSVRHQAILVEELDLLQTSLQRIVQKFPTARKPQSDPSQHPSSTGSPTLKRSHHQDSPGSNAKKASASKGDNIPSGGATKSNTTTTTTSNANDPLDADSNQALKALKHNLVQVKATGSEIDQRIDYFRRLKRQEINQSNQQEFFGPETRNPYHISCARVDLSEVNRAIQMKQQIVDNEDGPLMRSITTHPNDRADCTRANPKASVGDRYSGLEERIKNIAEHIDFTFKPHSSGSEYDRIRALEDHIIFIEREFPEWAMQHFIPPEDIFEQQPRQP